MKKISTLRKIESMCEVIHDGGQALAVTTQNIADTVKIIADASTLRLLKFMLNVIETQQKIRKKALNFIVLEQKRLEKEITFLDEAMPKYEKHIAKRLNKKK